MDLLQLVSIKGLLPKGGSTKPLLIEASDINGNIKPYVLKIYKEKHVTEDYSVAKEILANEIAKEFDLPVPNYGVINFDHKLLKDYYPKEYISLIDRGNKFCSEYLEGFQIFNPYAKNHVLKDYDLGGVFAFDNIILNTDRGGFRNKPNLLVNDDGFLLIDHELTMFFYSQKVNDNIDFKGKFCAYFFRKHIFYDLLKKKRNKDDLFEESVEHLRNFDLSKIDAIFAGLDNFNIRNKGKDNCYYYFKWLKDNNNFVFNTLKQRILS